MNTDGTKTENGGVVILCRNTLVVRYCTSSVDASAVIVRRLSWCFRPSGLFMLNPSFIHLDLSRNGSNDICEEWPYPDWNEDVAKENRMMNLDDCTTSDQYLYIQSSVWPWMCGRRQKDDIRHALAITPTLLRTFVNGRLMTCETSKHASLSRLGIDR